MKKLLLIPLVILLVFSSCTSEVENEPHTYVLPDFSQVNNAGRGLETIIGPESPFGNDFGLAGSILTSMPVIANLREVSSVEFDLENLPETELVFRAFGIKARPQINISVNGEKRTACRVNEDGIFMRYEIINSPFVFPETDKVIENSNRPEEHVVGYVDYYYSFKENAFSYRHYLMNTLYMPTDLIPGRSYVIMPNILNFEYIDIPVKKDLSFTTTDLVNGKLKKNAVNDSWNLGSPFATGVFAKGPTNEGSEGLVTYIRGYQGLSSSRNGMAVISPEYLTEGVAYRYWEDVPSFYELTRKYIGSDSKKNDGHVEKIENRANEHEHAVEYCTAIDGDNMYSFDIKFIQDLLETYYSKGAHIKETDIRNPEWNGETYESFEEFNADSLQERVMGKSGKWIFLENEEGLSGADLYETTDQALVTEDGFMRIQHSAPGVYDIRTRNGASVGITPNRCNNLGWLLIPENLKASKMAEFYKVSYDPDDTASVEKAVRTVIDKHLRECGITDSQFIRNYTEYALQLNHEGYYGINYEVTNAPDWLEGFNAWLLEHPLPSRRVNS